MPGAAFFDLDKTVIATSSMRAFAGQFLARGVTTRRALVRLAYAELIFRLGSADHEGTERLRRSISRLVAGWDVAEVNAIAAETLREVITPSVFAEALDLIDRHRAAGRDVIVISASGIELVAPIARMLGADHAVASRMAVAQGRYTGEVEFYCYGPAKAEAVRELASAHGYDLAASYAYSDSITDVPMLEQVAYPTVVNPDRTLRRLALERGWSVARFARPTPLRPAWTHPVVAAVLFTLAAGTVMAAGLSLTRRRTRAGVGRQM